MLFALVSTACGEGLDTQTRTQAITGGTVDLGDTAVLGLVTQAPLCGADSTTAQLFCTGALIAPRVVLTAAHCTSSFPLVGSRVYAGTDLASEPGQRLDVAELRRHPGWTAENPRVNDIALLVLEEPAPIAPVLPIETALDSAFVGTTVRVAGFGMDDAGQVGTKRQGTARVTALAADTFDLAAAPAMSCAGDSGGPVLVDVGGESRVAGVTSFGDAACRVGTNTRVDVHMSSFIAPVLAELAASRPSRPSITPELDTCTAACTDDADCPRGMVCLPQENKPNACALNGLPPGRFGQSCTEGGCPGGNCVEAGEAGCLCYQFCDAVAPPEDGCSAGRGRRGSGWLMMVVIAMLAIRRRTFRLLALASIMVGCKEPRGNCPEGAMPRGAAPPNGAQQFCVEKAQPTVRSGPYVDWYSDAKPPQKKREGGYKHGKLDGTWVSYFPDGKLERETTYVDGVAEGRSVEYHPSGPKKEEGTFLHGVRVGTWTEFYEGGRVWRKTVYSDNSQTQNWMLFSEDGWKSQEGSFVKGKKAGLYTEFFPDGNKAVQGTWAESKKHGKWTTWDAQGKVLTEEQYVEGESLAAPPSTPASTSRAATSSSP
jgi:antitoxin component YwqK of YwqJK toxin-antitoxin module/V8-like Glu-specific endopeptidase